jgi:cytochrome P450
MSDLGKAISFASGLYRQRVGTVYAGYVNRDPLALLWLRPGRVHPYTIYERMRASGPLAPTRLGNWVSTSHRVCAAVLRDRRFGTVPADGDPRRPEDEVEASFLTMNPPDHTRLRRLAQPSFSPKAMAGYRGLIEQAVAGLLDRAAEQDTFDLVPAFASPLPITVITELLGVPEEDSDGFAEYGASLAGVLDGVRSLRHAARLQADSDKLSRIFERLLELRRREPRDDIVSRLVAAEGDQVRPEEIMPLCVLLLIAGFETTVNLIGNAVLALLDHPDQWRALCEDPAGLAPKAVEETLRYDPPVQRTNRYALEAVELEGRPVSALRLPERARVGLSGIGTGRDHRSPASCSGGGMTRRRHASRYNVPVIVSSPGEHVMDVSLLSGRRGASPVWAVCPSRPCPPPRKRCGPSSAPAIRPAR